MRDNLYNATVVANYTTTLGTIKMTAFSNAKYDMADVHVVNIQATDGECNSTWSWTPLLADAMVWIQLSIRPLIVNNILLIATWQLSQLCL